MENGELKINSPSVYRGSGSKADEGVLFKIIKSKIPWAGYLILS